MGAQLYSRIAVPGPSRLLRSGLIGCHPIIRQRNLDITMFPRDLIPTRLYSLRKPWIGRQLLRQLLPVLHWTGLRHEFMERGQTCHTGQRSLQFGFGSSRCQGIGESYCKILLSTIFQLFRTCSSGPPPPFCDGPQPPFFAESLLILSISSFFYLNLLKI